MISLRLSHFLFQLFELDVVLRFEIQRVKNIISLFDLAVDAQLRLDKVPHHRDVELISDWLVREPNGLILNIPLSEDLLDLGPHSVRYWLYIRAVPVIYALIQYH